MVIPHFGPALATMIAFALGLVAVGRYRGLPATSIGILLLALGGLIVGSLGAEWIDRQGRSGDTAVYLLSALGIVIELIVITTAGRTQKPPRG